MSGFKDIPMIKGARTLVEINGNVHPGENVLIVTDTEMVDLAQIVATAAVERGAEVTISIMVPRASHGAEPPLPVAAAMQKADVIFAPTTTSLFHSQARRDATAAGARFCNMVDYRPWMLVDGGLRADFLSLVPLTERIADLLTQAQVARVTTPAGTDITLRLEGRAGYPQRGMARLPGQVSSPPDIEAAAAPLEGTARGRIVVDGSIPHATIGRLDETVTIIVEEGVVVRVEGGRQASALRALWESYRDPSVYNLAELGLGLNPEARLSGAMLEDEGVAGTVHFGFGDNRSFGGSVQAPLHLDAVVRNPTVMLDDVVVIQGGRVSA